MFLMGKKCILLLMNDRNRGQQYPVNSWYSSGPSVLTGFMFAANVIRDSYISSEVLSDLFVIHSNNLFLDIFCLLNTHRANFYYFTSLFISDICYSFLPVVLFFVSVFVSSSFLYVVISLEHFMTL